MAADSAPTLSFEPVLQAGELVAVTGANGAMGSRICEQLIQLGYRVRGIVRSVDRASWLKDFLADKYGPGPFELVQVSDLSKDDDCDNAIVGASGVVHTAADTTLGLDPNVVIPRILATALPLVKSAAKSATCRRFVYTTSSSAVTDPAPGVARKITVDALNEHVIKVAYSEDLPEGFVGGHIVYAAGKTKAEQQLWKWYRDEIPSFTLNVVVPSPCYGSILSPKRQGYSAANGVLKKLWEGQCTDDIVNMLEPQWFVDITDVTKLHLGSLLHPGVRGERLFGYADRYTINDILSIFRDACPDRDFPADIPGIDPDLTEVPNERSTEVIQSLGASRWKTLRECLVPLAEQWAELEE